MSPEPSKMSVAADTVCLRCGHRGAPEVLLVKRAYNPYKDSWAFPGGFVELDEDLWEAARREVQEETGLYPVTFDQVGAWGKPGRDPRGRTVSAVYCAIADPEDSDVVGADDAAEAKWHSLGRLPSLAFDHDEILPVVLDHFRDRCERTHFIFAFLPETFTETDLKNVLESFEVPGPGKKARRLLDASVSVESGGMGQYRLDVSRYIMPLREPVCMFPISSSEESRR
ncbi:MAG: NUDIX domain-containing protein [Planctomycetota bacterium]